MYHDPPNPLPRYVAILFKRKEEGLILSPRLVPSIPGLGIRGANRLMLGLRV